MIAFRFIAGTVIAVTGLVVAVTLPPMVYGSGIWMLAALSAICIGAAIATTAALDATGPRP